jgi:D-cysteine desulfhydrase
MAVNFPPRLKLAQTPTPLQLAERLSAKVGGPRIWIKRDDMTGCAVSGNKIRKLEFTLAEAKARGAQVIITAGGVQSNHCRTTALLCAQLGLACHLVLRGAEQPADGNLLLDRLAAANISYYPNAEYCAREAEILQHWQQHYEEQGKTAFCIPVGASDGMGLWGYIAACEELAADFKAAGIAPGHIISATGSGGTQAGLTAGNALFNLGAKVWGINVCDDEAYFMRKVAEDLRQWQQWYQPPLDVETLTIRVIDGYVGRGYAQCSDEVFATIKELAALEGVVLDPVYTGKAFHGLLDQIRQGRFDDSDDIVFIHTGGLFCLFAQRDQLGFN